MFHLASMEIYKLPTKLPREVSGQELADAVERAAKSLHGYEVRVFSDIGYKSGSFQTYETHRSISIDQNAHDWESGRLC